MRSAEQNFAKNPIQWNWLQLQHHGYDEPALTLPVAPPNIKRSAVHGVPVPTMEPHEDNYESKESGGSRVNHNFELMVEHTFRVQTDQIDRNR